MSSDIVDLFPYVYTPTLSRKKPHVFNHVKKGGGNMLVVLPLKMMMIMIPGTNEVMDQKTLPQK